MAAHTIAGWSFRRRQKDKELPMNARMNSGPLWIVLATLFAVSSPLRAQEFVKIGNVSVCADSPLAKGDRPRLMITRADLPKLRQRMNHPEIQTYLAQARDIVKLGKADSLLLATLYQLTGDKQYAEMAKQKLGEPSWLPQWSLAYDMLAETMTAAERADTVGKVLAVVKANRWRPRLLLCLAAWGSGMDEELAPYLEAAFNIEIRDRMRHHNNWSRGRGGSSMGHGYNAEHFFGPVFPAMMGWSHATGEDLSSQWDFAHNTPAWYIYHYLPWEKSRSVINIGVTRDGSHHDSVVPHKFLSGNYVMLPITQTSNGLGQWWQREFVGNMPQPAWDKGLEHSYGLAGRLLWLDPEIPSIPPEKFPETRLFPLNGHVVMRSGWTQDATVALFRCGRFGTIDGTNGRNNLDNLHFIIYRKGGYLAPDLGCVHNVNEDVWKMPNGSNVHAFSKQTIAHNTITVGRAPMKLLDYKNKGRVLAVVPRGGQGSIKMPEWFKAWGLDYEKESPDFKQGDITAYSTSPEFDYACGDATHSYPPKRVKNITRQFVYLKPDTFVIFDRVTPTTPELEAIWNLHAYTQPAWDGQTKEDEPAHPERPGGHFAHTAGNVFRIEKAESEMLVTTLLPRENERVVRTIGGKWHDFEINGVNHGPTEETYARLDKRKGDGGVEAIGGWRIEVSPTNSAAEAHFLHVLRTGDKGALEPATVSLLTKSEFVGAKIVLDGQSFEVMFYAQGDTGGHIRIADGKSLINEDLVTRIEDNYDRWKDDPRYDEWMTNDYMRTVIYPYGKRSR
jgi:hypothetical protein